MRSDDRPYTPADDEVLSGAMTTAYQRAGRSPSQAELAAEDERARRDMGDNPYPAGEEDEV